MENSNYINIFQNNLDQFLEALKGSDILENKDLAIEATEDNIKHYVTTLHEYEEQVTKCDLDSISEKVSSLLVLEDKLDLIKILKTDGLTKDHLNAIWKYIQTLYVVGRLVVSQNGLMEGFLEKLKESEKEAEKNIDFSLAPEKIDTATDKIKDLFKDTTAGLNTGSKESDLLSELIGDVAEEVGNTLKDQKDFNPYKMMNAMMSGDIEKAGIDFGGILEKLSMKVEEKMTKEGMTEDDLNNEASNMLNNMMQNPAFQNNPMLQSLMGSPSGTPGAGAGNVMGGLNPVMVQSVMNMMGGDDVSLDDLEAEAKEKFGTKTKDEIRQERRRKLREQIRKKKH